MERDRRNDLGLSAPGLVALLDYIERPAVLLGGDGAQLGANARFRELAGRQGAHRPDVASVLAAESLARLMLLLGRPRPARESVELALRDGASLTARVELPEAAGALKPVLLVFEAGSGAPRAATSSLRHDIAGPLTAILGTAELALLRGGDRVPADVREAFGQILENCGRISEILHKSRAAERLAGEEP